MSILDFALTMLAYFWEWLLFGLLCLWLAHHLTRKRQ